MKTMYKWIVLQSGEVVASGILEESVEIDVEKIFPKANSFADRCLSELQEYADTYLSEYNYDFRYVEVEIDFSDLMET